MKKRVICFDLDNTLIKSNQCHLKAYQLAFRKNKVQRTISNARILRHFGEGSKQIVQRLFPKKPEAFINTLVEDHDYFVRMKTKHMVRAVAGARKVISKLRRQWKLVIISNCNHKTIITLLHATHFPLKWFALIIGQDQVKRPKPAPDELLKAKQILKRPIAYFIGDSIYDIRAGRRAGVKVIAIPSGVHSARQLQKEKPLSVCKNITGVLKKIQ